MADFSGLLPAGGPIIGAAQNIDFAGLISPPILDTLPPTVTLVSPAPGTKIARNTAFVVDVSDDGNFYVMLYVKAAEARLYEVAYDGDRFADLYALHSTRVGNRFTLRREGGWPAAPTFTVRAFDGNMA